MSILDRLRALADALPSDGSAVTLTRTDIRAMLDEGAEESTPASKDLTVEEVAAEVGRAPSTVRGWLISGELRGFKLNGRDWRVPRAALREYLERQAGKNEPPAATVDADIGAWRRLVS